MVAGGATKDGDFSRESRSSVQYEWPLVKSVYQLGDAGVYRHGLTELFSGLQSQEEAWEQTDVE